MSARRLTNPDMKLILYAASTKWNRDRLQAIHGIPL